MAGRRAWGAMRWEGDKMSVGNENYGGRSVQVGNTMKGNERPRESLSKTHEEYMQKSCDHVIQVQNTR